MVRTYDLGFLGGGQLARMSIQAAQRMGYTCLSLDPGEGGPAAQVADAIVGRLDDPSAVAQIFRQCGAVTLENEFIPADTIRQAITPADEDRLVPSLDALATIQDKLKQRLAYERAGVPSPRAASMDADPISTIGFPMVLKARFGGYDGKGTRYARTPEELALHRPLWEKGGWLAEEFVPFRREVSVMVYVGPEGVGCYPTMETVQRDHVCDLVFTSGSDASKVAIAAVQAVGGRGLFGVELFETVGGDFLINEIAPRPHNTGHYTLDWGDTSQFEQHVRVVLGLPNGSVNGIPVAMANLLGLNGAGDYRKAVAAALTVPGAHFHWYGKAEAKAGRKMGHINVVGDRTGIQAANARLAFYDAWTRLT